MGEKTYQLGASTYSAFTSDATGTDFTSKFRAYDYYTSNPVTGGIGQSGSPILFTAVAVKGMSGSGDIRLQLSTSANGSGGDESGTIPLSGTSSTETAAISLPAWASTHYYYGFVKLDTTTVSFSRGDGDNPNAIYKDGTSYDPTTSSGILTWPQTSISGTVVWSQAPTAPQSLTKTASTSSSITLDWTAPADNGGESITGYRVLYKVRGVGSDTDPDTWTSTGKLGTTTAKTVTGLAPSTTYDFRVAAVNGVTDAHNASYTDPAAVTGPNAVLNSQTTNAATVYTGATMPKLGILNRPYEGQINATGTGITYSVASMYGTPAGFVNGLPPGVTLNTSTGALTGTPTQVGQYAFRILLNPGTVYAPSSTSNFTVTVSEGTPTVITAVSPEVATSRSSMSVYANDTWNDAWAMVYDDTYTNPDTGTHWKPIL